MTTALAIIVAVRFECAGSFFVVMPKPWLICPAGMVTVSPTGMFTSEGALFGSGRIMPVSTAARDTVESVGTGPSNVTVPLLETPPVPVEGNNVRLWRTPTITFGCIVNVAQTEVPSYLA